jgi:hypothetical protein
MPEMTEAEYAAVNAALAGLTSAVRSLEDRMRASGNYRPAPSCAEARSSAATRSASAAICSMIAVN